MKIKINKNTYEVVFKCNCENEMKYILDTYIKGCEANREEARKILEEKL
jgi:hypothetical protein